MKKLLFVLLVVLVALGSGFAGASIPSSEGEITACYNNATGLVRVIDAEAGQTCPATATEITWNQVGPQGPAGPAGPVGPSGGVQGLEYISASSEGIPALQTGTLRMACPEGKSAIAGGHSFSFADGSLEVIRSKPDPGGSDLTSVWEIVVLNNGFQGNVTRSFTGWVVCAVAND